MARQEPPPPLREPSHAHARSGRRSHQVWAASGEVVQQRRGFRGKVWCRHSSVCWSRFILMRVKRGLIWWRALGPVLWAWSFALNTSHRLRPSLVLSLLGSKEPRGTCRRGVVRHQSSANRRFEGVWVEMGFGSRWSWVSLRRACVHRAAEGANAPSTPPTSPCSLTPTSAAARKPASRPFPTRPFPVASLCLSLGSLWPFGNFSYLPRLCAQWW